MNTKPRLVAWDYIDDEPKPDKPQVFERQDWPVMWLPDRAQPGEYREHTIKRRMGF